jgi:hypothetical protein
MPKDWYLNKGYAEWKGTALTARRLLSKITSNLVLLKTQYDMNMKQTSNFLSKSE